MAEILRGQIYLAKHPDLDDKKYFVVASNNRRNKSLGSVLCLRVTSTDKKYIPTCVELTSNVEGLGGYIVCDDVYLFYAAELESPVTALTDATMSRVEVALKKVFAIRD